MSWEKELYEILGAADAEWLIPRIKDAIKAHRVQAGGQKPASGQHIALITYPDQFSEPGEPKLKSFQRFADRYIGGVFDVIHFLPFCPYSSDDGFSVVDYLQVAPELGDWADLSACAEKFTLMYDFVCNHISSRSSWARGFTEGTAPYDSFFIQWDPAWDYSNVIRPRTSELFSTVETNRGAKKVWTTFSADQWDLNYRSPELILQIVEVFLTYLSRGGSWIRLDAIGYLWKESGAECLNHPKTHAFVRFLRGLLEEVCPGGRLITETNVPHQDNVAYFGDGSNESHMVYQFSLPVLTLYSFFRENAAAMTRWAEGLSLPSEDVTFFNFLASHDGVGLNPAQGILPEQEILEMAEFYRVRAGALISEKELPDGGKAPYELNVSYFSALAGGDGFETALQRFLTAHAMLLGMKGIPAVYIHSYLGSENYLEGVARTGQKRTINREKFALDALCRELRSGGRRETVRKALEKLIRTRRAQDAFDTRAPQKILRLDERVFAFVRGAGIKQVLCLHNFSREPVKVELPGKLWKDLLCGTALSDACTLPPYGFKWLAIEVIN